MLEEDFIYDFVQIIETKRIGIDKEFLRESMRELLLGYSVSKKNEPDNFLSYNAVKPLPLGMGEHFR